MNKYKIGQKLYYCYCSGENVEIWEYIFLVNPESHPWIVAPSSLIVLSVSKTEAIQKRYEFAKLDANSAACRILENKYPFLKEIGD